ncbi:MAG: hypothetical protein JWQ86_929 [Mycobacterium sp.]|nr:hypothetical protein [Mycobacterium sp.]MCW2789505.1 hypothetical protein [Aeromicrobium sp.]
MSRLSTIADSVEVEEMSVDDARAMFRGQVRDRLDIEPGEFLARLDAGEYASSDDDQVIRLMMLAPFGR